MNYANIWNEYISFYGGGRIIFDNRLDLEYNYYPSIFTPFGPTFASAS